MEPKNVNVDFLREVFEKDYVIVFIGQSACGKETQSKALMRIIKQVSPGKEIFFSETGGLYRKEIPFFSKYNKNILDSVQSAGKLQNWITTSALWAHNFMYNYNGGVIIVDGSPRNVDEAKAFVDFYHGHAGKEIIVFFIGISDIEARERMILRNRNLELCGKEPRNDSDTPEKRKTKLEYFHTDVKPALEYLKKAKGVHFNKLAGKGKIDFVTNRILQILQNYH